MTVAIAPVLDSQAASDDGLLTSAAPRKIVPVGEKMAYGAAGVTDFLYLNFPLAMATPIFCVKMGMSPALLGIAMAIAKIAGALIGPFVGSASDNRRGRFGRRKPYMFVGAAAGALAIPLLWFPPVAPVPMFIYITLFITLISVFSSIYSIPYAALGLELTDDYEDRTRVQAWKGYVQTIGLFGAAWFYWFCLRPVFGNEVIGVRWLSIIVVLAMVVGAVCSLVGNRETERTQTHQPIPVWPALRMTLQNKPFLILIGTLFIMSFAQGCTGVLGQYIHIFYSCHGDKDLSARISGFGGSLTLITATLAMPMGLALAHRFGKRQAAMAGIAISLFSSLIMPWTINPDHPELVVISWVCGSLGVPCFVLIFSSMLADICDEDELTTGMRREGAFCAVNLLQGRIMLVLMLAVGGFLPLCAGYTQAGISSAAPTIEQLLAMKRLLIIIQCIGVLASLFLMATYPITHRRAEANRAELQRRAMRAADGVSSGIVGDIMDIR